MPKTNVKGGKKKKRGKNGLNENNKIIFIDEDDTFQMYGQVSKILGNGSFSVSCFKKDKENDFEMIQKLCLVRGKMRKRNWININDIVVVSLREFENNKSDIVHKYSNDEARILINMNKIPNINISNLNYELNDDVNFSFDIEKNNIKKEKSKDNNSYYNLPETFSEDEDEEINNENIDLI